MCWCQVGVWWLPAGRLPWLPGGPGQADPAASLPALSHSQVRIFLTVLTTPTGQADPAASLPALSHAQVRILNSALHHYKSPLTNYLCTRTKCTVVQNTLCNRDSPFTYNIKNLTTLKSGIWRQVHLEIVRPIYKL